MLSGESDIDVRLRLLMLEFELVVLRRFSLRRFRREIIWVFFMLRPKKMYKISPTAGKRINTVTHASDFTGFLFSDKMIIIVLNIVKE